MKKEKLRAVWLIVICSLVVLSAGCGNKDKALARAEEFIKIIVDCETYKDTDEPTVRAKLCEYFTDEGYDEYKANQFLYDYALMYSLEKAESCKIDKIKCTKKENDDYFFEVKYTVQAGKEARKQTDQIQITMNKEGKYTRVLLLNTSDVISFVEVKVQ